METMIPKSITEITKQEQANGTTVKACCNHSFSAIVNA